MTSTPGEVEAAAPQPPLGLGSFVCTLPELAAWMDQTRIELRFEVFCGTVTWKAGHTYKRGHSAEGLFKQLGAGSTPSKALLDAYRRESGFSPALQDIELRDHHAEQFGDVSLSDIITKLYEECGEVAGAITRHRERRDGREWKEEVQKETGHALTVIGALIARNPELFDGVNLEHLYHKARARFLDRKWDNIQETQDS